jgi:hypothetical protein
MGLGPKRIASGISQIQRAPSAANVGNQYRRPWSVFLGAGLLHA